MQSVKIDRYLRLGIGVLAAVLVFVIYAAIHQRVVEAGDAAPDFTLTADNGRTVTLPNFGGKLLLLNFWASWCGPCAEETPSLSQVAQDYASKGLVVLGISVDKDPAAYQRFLQKYSPAFLTARELKIHEDYGTYQYPETYFIDAKGHVIYKIADPADWNDARLRKYIESLL
jgi:cytochrome c biogenesis protein CcmG, thiol:disulfide interchange protein DsbE